MRVCQRLQPGLPGAAAILPLILGCLRASEVPAENAARPGEVQPEPATLRCLAVRWPVLGDANENAAVAVDYRKAGQEEWKKGYPLFRTLQEATKEHREYWSFNDLKAERVPGGRLYAGSIVDLDPETEYEVRLGLQDPDGGGTEKVLKMKTRGEPREPPGMRTRYVEPGTGGGQGTAQDPFRGLPAAAQAAQAGDLFLLKEGVYKIEETVEFKHSGEPGRPIIFRGAGPGDAVLDGGGDHESKGRLISADGTKHLWLEDLALQGRQYMIVAHESSHWVIRRCRFQKMEKGFTAHNGGYHVSRDHFIGDNVFVGPTTWPRTKGIESFCSIYMTGSGHVVCYNHMANLGDGIHGCGHGNLSASDYHNNEICVGTDDGFETDYSVTNVRVYRNRIVNVAHGITAQPAQGGPIYIFRNTIYNATYSPFKLHNHTCGVLLFHNTCLRNGPCWAIQPANETVTEIVTRNNLFLGTSGSALPTTGRMTRCDFDNDGYGGFTGAFASWNGKSFKTMEAAKASGLLYKERGAIEVRPRTCFASGLLPPTDTKREYKHAELDFRLKEGSGALDKGVVLPNFNDVFAGQAPDLGAFEFGAPVPQYGPRPKKE